MNVTNTSLDTLLYDEVLLMAAAHTGHYSHNVKININFYSSTLKFIGLLAIQTSPSLQNLSGFDGLETVGMLVIAFLGSDMEDMDAFNSLHTAGTIIITRNMVCTIITSLATIIMLSYVYSRIPRIDKARIARVP